jgi:hypothetical protein
MNAVMKILETPVRKDARALFDDVMPRTNSAAQVILFPQTGVRSLNLRMFESLCARVHEVHGEIPELQDLRSRAQIAMGRFQVPVLGPGMARLLGEMKDGHDGYRNVLGMLVHADAMLSTGDCHDAADAIVRAFAAHHRTTLTLTRNRLIQASHDCEFFSPELVLMLEALSYE